MFGHKNKLLKDVKNVGNHLLKDAKYVGNQVSKDVNNFLHPTHKSKNISNSITAGAVTAGAVTAGAITAGAMSSGGISTGGMGSGSMGRGGMMSIKNIENERNMYSNNSYFDTGLIQIQNDYLDSIKGNVNLSQDQISQINDVQKQLSTINSKLGNSSANALYSQQKNMIDILNKEEERLNLKKDKIDSALSGKQRILELNESYRARNADYIHILSVFVFALTIVLIVNRILNAFAVSSTISNIIYIIILSITIIYMIMKYIEISARDTLYYDKLDLKPPKILTPEEIKKQTEQKADDAKYSNVSDLIGTINVSGCIGASCCGGDTVWDADNSVCIKKKSGFTTLENNNEIIQPNSPNEFIHYSIYK